MNDEPIAKIWEIKRKKQIIAVLIVLLFLINLNSIASAITIEKEITKQDYLEGKSTGNILYVGGSGPGNYTHIQDAINDSSDGDTVFVYFGSYYENIIIDKSVEVVGENKYTTFINYTDNGKHPHPVFRITANNVKISGFTIGYHLSIQHADNVLVKDNIIDSVRANYSNYCSLESNIIIRPWVAVALSTSCNNNIKDNNISGFVYGVQLFNCSNNNIIECNNITHYRPPGQYCGSNTGIILQEDCTNNKIINNNILKFNNGIRLLFLSNRNEISYNSMDVGDGFGFHISQFNIIKYNIVLYNGKRVELNLISHPPQFLIIRQIIASSLALPNIFLFNDFIKKSK